MQSDAIFQTILEREASLRIARAALEETCAMPNATQIMRDSANEAVSNLIDEITKLRVQFFAAVDAETAVVFDVPGTVTLNDVAVPAQRETFDARVIRLAQKAVIQGCQIVHEDAVNAYVTSSQNPKKAYWVGIDRQMSRYNCECAGFKSSRICKHLSLVMVSRGIVAATNQIAA